MLAGGGCRGLAPDHIGNRSGELGRAFEVHVVADAVEGDLAGAAEESTEVAQDIQAAEAAAGETVDPAIEAAAETN